MHKSPQPASYCLHWDNSPACSTLHLIVTSEHYFQILKEGDCPSLLCTGLASPGALCAGLGDTGYKGDKATGECPQEGCKIGEGFGEETV